MLSARCTSRIAGANSALPDVARHALAVPALEGLNEGNGHRRRRDRAGRASSLADWQCDSITCCTLRPAVARNLPTMPIRRRRELP